MLTRGQIRLIRRSGISTFHDYWLTSLSSGEPFFENDILSYFDGRFVTICACRFRNRPAIPVEALNQVILKWADIREVQGLAVIGAQLPDLHLLSKYGFRKTYEEESGELSAELLIDCSRRADTIFNQRTYRRSSKLGFDAVIRSGGLVSAEYLKLIELFYSVRDITCYLADVAFTLPALLRSNRIIFVEARKNGKLCGFVGLHKAFNNIAVAFFLTHDHQTPNVCDFLYAKMLDQARELGAESINIGSCPTSGHYKFKRKWSGTQGGDEYNYAEWSRGLLARRLYKTWGPRIVRL